VLESGDSSDAVRQTEGTYHFMAPEACDPDIDEYSGKAADVWALGVTLFSLLYSKCPYWGETDYQLMESIKDDPVQIPSEEVRQVSPEMTQVLMSMLQKDVTLRASLADILANQWLY